MQSLSYLTDPIQYPPALPIPGDGQSSPEVERELTPSFPLRANMGQAFPHFCTLWTWTAEIMCMYRGVGGPQNVSLANAQAKYRKLLTWTDSLPGSMTCGDHRTHDILIFQ